MTTTLVTGATGFLGGTVARLLVDRGHDVVALVRASSDRSGLDPLGVRYVEGDVTDRDSVAEAIDGVDLVIHSAAMVGFDPADGPRLDAVNVTGTDNVVGLAADAGIRTVHVSSTAALGPTGPDQEDESYWNPEESTIAYERTKRLAHMKVQALAAAGAPVRIAIPGGIYGPGDDSQLGQAIRFYQRSPVSIGWLPDVHHSTVHVEDCALGIIAMAESGTDGSSYLLCAETVSMRDWIDMLRTSAGRRPPRVWVSESATRRTCDRVDALLERLGRPGGRLTGTARMAMRSFAYSGDKARTELGWKPRTLFDGLRELAIA